MMPRLREFLWRLSGDGGILGIDSILLLCAPSSAGLRDVLVEVAYDMGEWFLGFLCSLTMAFMIELDLKYLVKVGITGAGYFQEDCQAGYKLGVVNASSILCCCMHIARSIGRFC